MTSRPQPHVIVGRRGRLGRITLNRPGKINALTVRMIIAVRGALQAFAGDDGIDTVLVDGAGGRGLSAGGDLAAVYHGIRGGADSPETFWGDEYRMNLEISRYPKPVVAFMDGIVMGGGVGISGHAAVRVVTETSQVAMPETAIGLSPDVGGLYLLARSPGLLGTHAALTGARLGPADAIAAGLADHFVPRANLAGLADRLAAGGDAAAVVAADSEPAPAGRWPSDRPWIDACYSADGAAEILHRLRGRREPAAHRAADALAAVSPTAAAVALRAIRNARTMTLRQVLEQDMMLCTRFLSHPDFVEGIRALIIDKDRAPRWCPASLRDVGTAEVEAFFVPRRTSTAP